MQRRRPPPRNPNSLTDLTPPRIITKILLLQLSYYTTATILIVFTTLVAGAPFTLDLVLSWRSVRGDTTVGWTLSFVWLLNALFGVITLVLLLTRSKQIPDFALTIHALHLIITSFYTHSLPQNWLWWALQATSAALMTSLGIWSCRWRELQPISFGGKGAASASTAGTANGEAAGAAGASQGEEEAGFAMGRGRGRGRNRDGGGEYEMVGIKEEVEGEAV